MVLILTHLGLVSSYAIAEDQQKFCTSGVISVDLTKDYICCCSPDFTTSDDDYICDATLPLEDGKTCSTKYIDPATKQEVTKIPFSPVKGKCYCKWKKKV